MGADAREAAATLAKVEAEALARQKALAKENCIECDEFGPWCDGEFHYCAEHVPHRLRHRGRYWQEDAHKR